jgi:5-methylcytosine-specific restriction endonuclease McrA
VRPFTAPLNASVRLLNQAAENNAKITQEPMMPHVSVQLVNGNRWLITNCELILPVNSLGDMSAEEIGQTALNTDEVQGYLWSDGQDCFDSIEEFLEVLETWKRAEAEKRQREERRKQARSTNKSKESKPNAMRIRIWAKTGGRCYYCGSLLEHKTTFCIDHIVPRISGGGDELENVVPACRSCNSAKGTKQLEEFRFYKRMQKYEKQNGVSFNAEQLSYLRGIGMEINIPPHLFWFEAEER